MPQINSTYSSSHCQLHHILIFYILWKLKIVYTFTYLAFRLNYSYSYSCCIHFYEATSHINIYPRWHYLGDHAILKIRSMFSRNYWLILDHYNWCLVENLFIWVVNRSVKNVKWNKYSDNRRSPLPNWNFIWTIHTYSLYNTYDTYRNKRMEYDCPETIMGNQKL